MTADKNLDPTENNEDDFILEDAPVNDLEDLFQVPPTASSAKSGQKKQPSDLLFEPTDAAAEQADHEGNSKFSETGKSSWPGKNMSASDMGLPVASGNDDPLNAEDSLDADRELEVIGDDVASRAPSIDGVNAYPVRDASEDFPVEAGWEPVSATPGRITDDQADLSTVDETESEERQQEAASDSQVESEYDASGAATAMALGRVIGSVGRRSRTGWMPMAAAAAAVLVGGAIVTVQPEWIGLHFAPQLVERVQVARPSVEVRTPTPPMPVIGKIETEPKQSLAAKPDAGSVENANPVATASTTPLPSVPSDSQTTAEPVATNELEMTAIVTAPLLDKSQMLPVGESLWIGDFVSMDPRSDQIWLGVGLGSKAFAQLRNGNYFIGSVKAVAASSLVMRVGTGEVTLHRGEVEKLTALDSEEYQELQKVTNGVIRLNNRNRLVGTILKSVADDHYVLQMRSDRIVVPKQAVEELIEQSSDHLRFDTGQKEEAWLKDMATRELYPSKAPVKTAGSKPAKTPEPSKKPASVKPVK
jgi:hypothetical protein